MQIWLRWNLENLVLKARHLAPPAVGQSNQQHKIYQRMHQTWNSIFGDMLIENNSCSNTTWKLCKDIKNENHDLISSMKFMKCYTT